MFALTLVSSLAFAAFLESPALSADVLVHTPKGDLRGSLMTSRSGRDIFAFRGVRYAKPPTGELRFKDPVALTEDWRGALDATADGASCMQATDFLDGPTSEDCLFLNVYTTKLPSKDSKPQQPVVVWFHPGGWFMGSGQSNWAGPQYILDEDIVFVAINNRLGAFGFLSTGDAESPGNYALKDQQLALKWIHDNIQSFGGDPNLVTLFGSTSGSAGAEYHMLSPQSAGLFHRILATTGSFLCSWALNRNPMAIAREQAKLLNCPHDEGATSKDIVECLRGKDAAELAKSFSGLREWNLEPFVIYSPVVESQDTSSQPFLTDEPAKLLNAGNFTQVPIITGLTKNEMIQRAYAILNNDTLLNDWNTRFNELAPYTFYFEKGTETSKELSEKIKEKYYKGSKISKEALQPTSDMFTDSFFLYGVDQSVKIISEKSREPVYYYYLTYVPQNISATIKEGQDKPSGPQATDDLSYALYAPRLFPFYGTDHPEYLFSKYLVKFLANFARTGNPTPVENDKLLKVKWNPYSQSDPSYLDIGPDSKMEKGNIRPEEAHFWETIYKTSHTN